MDTYIAKTGISYKAYFSPFVLVLLLYINKGFMDNM